MDLRRASCNTLIDWRSRYWDSHAPLEVMEARMKLLDEVGNREKAGHDDDSRGLFAIFDNPSHDVSTTVEAMGWAFIKYQLDYQLDYEIVCAGSETALLVWAVLKAGK